MFTKQIDRLTLDSLTVTNFEIEVGGMEYGIPLDGIIGLDFLMTVQAVINLAQMRIEQTTI